MIGTLRIPVMLVLLAFISIGLDPFQPVFCQEVITNSDGERIVVYPDGSWRFYEEADELPQNTAERPNVEDQLSAAIAGEKRAFEQVDVFRSNRLKLEELLESAKNRKASSLELRSLKSRLKVAKKEEKQAFEHYENMHERVRSLRVEAGVRSTSKTRKIKNDKADYHMQETEQVSSSATSVQTSRPFYSMDKPEAYAEAPENTSMLIERNTCALSTETRDQFTDAVRHSTPSETLFFSLPAQLKPFLNGKPHILGRAYLTRLEGGRRFLTLEIDVRSERAQLEFGGLSKGRSLVVSFLDGTSASIVNRRTDKGKVVDETGVVRYTGQFAIEPQNEKKMSRKSIDRIRVVWDSGYEDYEVYDTDFLMRHLHCLEQ